MVKKACVLSPESLTSIFKRLSYGYRIPEEKVERADWEIKLGRFQFLVEQKSTFLRLSIKQQATDIDAIKKFAKDTIFKAMKQLQKTEQDFNNGQYIKVILLYLLTLP